ncbi:MAG: magnesium transporter [Pseudomonadota bacterium]
MASVHDIERPQGDAIPAFRSDEGHVTSAFVDAIDIALHDHDMASLKALAGDLHEADLADLLEALNSEDRAALITLLGNEFDFTSLTEVDDAVREEILEDLSNTVIARNVRDLENDDAVFILENLNEEDREDVLSQLPLGERLELQRGLEYQDDTVGRLMQNDFIAVPPEWTVEQTIAYCQNTQGLPEDFYEIFVIGPGNTLLGEATLGTLLRADRHLLMGMLMKEPKHAFNVNTDQEEAARSFQRYNLISAPVTDKVGRLAGVLMIDDMVDVIEEEADADIKALGGVNADEEISDNVFRIAFGRFNWLFINLLTAIAASAVIGLFQSSLQKMVALAVLMPIVASQGGNAGTQTMTVAVRALATRELRRSNAMRVVLREGAVGLFNGLAFAAIVGVIAGAWFQDVQLGLVIAFAMLANLLAAAFAGVLVPIAMDRMKVDPAVASGTFVTTVTDIVGFFAFLATATLWFGL